MSDELDDLKAMLQATPAPDGDTKARHIAAAEKNFETLQGSADPARHSPDRTGWLSGLSNGVQEMMERLTSKAGLAATSGLVAVGLAVVLVVPQMQDGLRPDLGIGTEVEIDAGTRADTELAVNRPATEAADQVAADAGTSEPMVLDAPIVMEQAMEAEAPLAPAPALQGRAETFAVQGIAENRARIAPAPTDDMIFIPESNTESFANEAANPVKVTAEEPVSTFSIDVDTASYALVRSSLNAGYLPPKEAVRIEEMINYFPYDYPAPEGEQPFSVNVATMETPWNPDTQLVHIGLQGAVPDADRPPLNLVFLIDTSGSMHDANKLPLLKQSFRLMLDGLSETDEVAIVTYAGSAGEVLAPVAAGNRAEILAALDRLEAGGSTAGQAGLQQAYAVAEGMAGEGEVTRVILATDGDFNVGLSDPSALEDYIAKKRESGTYLSVLGFGRGNLQDATMQALAQNGNGTASYIDTLNEAQKVLVDQLSGALYPIADDVKIQVEFNPATVAEYRLIGYETRALAREDFNNDKVDAGEIGAGHRVTAIYEVTPVGSPAILNDPLRYGAATPASDGSDELGFLRLRYKAPGEATSQLIETPIPADMAAAGEEARFAAAIAGFGQLLTGSKYVGDWGYGDAITLANGAKGSDAFGYRTEAVQLMRLADSLSRE